MHLCLMDASPFGNSFRHTMRSLASPNNTGGYLSSVSSYYDHPHLARSAIDDYGPLKAKAESASVAHESNSKAVLSALKGLKEKIRKLELERDKADRNLQHLAIETTEYKDMLQKEHSLTEEKQGQVEIQNKELEGQLKGAELRCELLEEQLQRMRAVAQSAHTLSPPSAPSRVHFSSEPKPAPAYLIHDQSPHQIEKLAELERDHMKLTLSHSLAENKIRDLEEKIKEEKHQRKLLQDKAAELQSMAESNRILLSLTSPSGGSTKPTTKRKKKVKKTECTSRKSVHQSPIQDHYHLDFKNIPFVVGKSTGESHSLGANVQSVLSLMKSHNPHLCKTMPRQTRQQTISGGESSSDSGGSLTELLSALQDEFGHMGFEHSELIKTIEETNDQKERLSLEKELQNLVSRMETKGEQISLLKHHQDKHRIDKKKKTKTKTSKEVKNSRGAEHHRSLSLKGSEVEVVTTIKTKSKTPSSPKLRTNRTAQSLETFRKVKKLQTSLQKDDLSWD